MKKIPVMTPMTDYFPGSIQLIFMYKEKKEYGGIGISCYCKDFADYLVTLNRYLDSSIHHYFIIKPKEKYV